MMGISSDHPIHQIPDEVLSKIFLVTTLSSLSKWDEPDPTAGYDSILPFPLVACAVCHLWRSAALSSPELWATITTPMSMKGTNSLRFDPVKFTRLWLERSRAAPLHVYLPIPPLALALNLAVEVIVPEVMRHSNRLRTLFINADFGGLHFPNYRGLLSAIRTRTEANSPLRHVSIRFSPCVHTQVTENESLIETCWGQDTGTTSPFSSVQMLRVEGIRIGPAFFPSLVSLVLWDLTSTPLEFTRMITALPNLRRLSLLRLRTFVTEDRPTPVIVPNLEFLALSFSRRLANANPAYPATYLRLPNLKILELDGEVAVPICSCLDSAFATSISNLETLRLRNQVRFALDSGSSSTWTDIQLLHKLLSIRSLELINSSVGALLHTERPPSSRQRRSSLRTARPTISPRLAETSRNLDAMFQQMRINGRQEEAVPEPAALDVPGESVSSVPPITWPNLESVSLDSMNVQDLVSLCRYVSKNRNIKTVRLSATPRRHLSQSVKHRIGDGRFYAPTFISSRKAWGGSKEEAVGTGSDVESAQTWMEGRVQILPFEHDL
ncbi:hypothetical protein CC2G_012235 [Coprinopsis cinerea AmutBmut pab1-1]|nr:hypothetical protein CC2G_012235 [Coprinopsis cinerea AmutBmut pab1-1]